MLQYGLLALALVCGTSSAAYSSSTQQGTYTGTYGNNGQNGAAAGAAAGASTGGIYGGNQFGFNGQHHQSNGNYGGQYPYANGGFPQQFPFAGNDQYQHFANNFWNQFGQNFQNAATMTYATPGAHAYAFASAAPHAYSLDLYKQQLAHQQALFHQFQQQAQGANFGGAQGGPNGFYAPNFAGSSASHGPGGFHQTASITPANPDSPNVDTRFGGDDKPIVTVSSGPQGFHGVSTSSFSSSVDNNGQKESHREASTSVNDNGKVTTYTVRS